MTINTGSYKFDEFISQGTELAILERQAELAVSLEKTIWGKAGLKPDMNVLDMGCGNGITSSFMAEYVHAGSVLGVDFSETLIANAKLLKVEKNISNLKFSVGNIYSMSVSENKFDFIYCRLLFQHLNEPVKALRNIARLLKPDGIICIVDIDDSWLMLYPELEDARSLIYRSAKSQENDGGSRYIGRKLSAYLHSADFSEINTQVEVISSFDVGWEAFLKISFGFRIERLPEDEVNQAKRELKNIHAISASEFAWGALGIFVATGKNKTLKYKI